MSIAFYRDLNGYVGEPRRWPDDAQVDAADDAMRDMLAEATNLAGMADRWPGSNGDDASAIKQYLARLTLLAAEFRAFCAGLDR
jgi:hypothetical protein